MRTIIIALCLIVLAVPAFGQDGHPCDPYAPYYMKAETGPGALLADLLFFTMSTPIAVAVVGGPRRHVVNTRTGQRLRVASAACLPISTARHFVQNRPPHVEHWRADCHGCRGNVGRGCQVGDPWAQRQSAVPRGRRARRPA